MDPRHSPTVGSEEEVVSYERSTLVGTVCDLVRDEPSGLRELLINPGKYFFLSCPGNASYYTNSLKILVRRIREAIFIAK